MPTCTDADLTVSLHNSYLVKIYVTVTEKSVFSRFGIYVTMRQNRQRNEKLLRSVKTLIPSLIDVIWRNETRRWVFLFLIFGVGVWMAQRLSAWTWTDLFLPCVRCFKKDLASSRRGGLGTDTIIRSAGNEKKGQKKVQNHTTTRKVTILASCVLHSRFHPRSSGKRISTSVPVCILVWSSLLSFFFLTVVVFASEVGCLLGSSEP